MDVSVAYNSTSLLQSFLERVDRGSLLDTGWQFVLIPRAGSGVVRIDPLRFLTGCCTRRLNQALSVLSVLSLSLGLFLSVSVVLLTRATFCFVLLCVLSLGCSC